MKVTWEPEDIKPGRRYGRPGVEERWIIGYVITGVKRFVSVSEQDGLIITPEVSCEEMAHYLTEEGYLPKELL